MKIWVRVSFGSYRAQLSIGNQSWDIGNETREKEVAVFLADQLANALRKQHSVVSCFLEPSPEEP